MEVTMETKSRYEIIAELEEKKATLLNGKASMGLREAQLNRAIEIAQENLREFTDGKEIQLANITDQLASIESSLDRFNSQKK